MGASSQSFACDVIRLAPGRAQTVRFKIGNVQSNLLLDAGGFYGQRPSARHECNGEDCAHVLETR